MSELRTASIEEAEKCWQRRLSQPEVRDLVRTSTKHETAAGCYAFGFVDGVAVGVRAAETLLRVRDQEIARLRLMLTMEASRE